jgi:hypothetical protein
MSFITTDKSRQKAVNTSAVDPSVKCSIRLKPDHDKSNGIGERQGTELHGIVKFDVMTFVLLLSSPSAS